MQNSEKAQNEPFHSGPTASRLAGQYNVAHETIKRDAKLAEELSFGDPASLKHTLRSFINELEELYKNL